MSKIINSLLMLNIIKKEKIITSIELAELLGTTPRMIREYKKELIAAGYKLCFKSGKHGGYFLDDIYLNDKELLSLYEALKVLKECNFKYIEDFERAYRKIMYKEDKNI